MTEPPAQSEPANDGGDSAIPDRWSDKSLDAKRERGDPVADAVIDSLLRGREVRSVDDALLALRADADKVPGGLPPEVSRYLESTSGTEPLDDDIRTAQELFAELGPEVLLCLGFYSLPAAYAARRGVQVLHRTAFLGQRPMRRVFETTRMMIDTMSPGGLGPDGQGVRTIQKVRLMHAAIRQMLLRDPRTPWDPELGVPVNQEDLAGTLMTFSYVVLSGLDRLGVKIDSDRADGYVRAWSRIGARMGIDADLLPLDADEAKILTIRIRERQVEPCPEGRDLTLALVDGYSTLMPHLPKSLPAAMVHYFLDNDPILHQNVAALLAVPEGGWSRVFRHLIETEVALKTHLEGVVHLSPATGRWVSRHLVRGLLDFQGSAQAATFSIPDQVYRDWELDVPGAAV